jgi:hypothetical protein
MKPFKVYRSEKRKRKRKRKSRRTKRIQGTPQPYLSFVVGVRLVTSAGINS